MSSDLVAPTVPENTAIETSRSGNGRKWIILGVLWLTLLVSYFDRTGMSIALPFMTKDLGLTQSVAGLVSGALFLSDTMVQVPAGWLADRFGQRRLIAIAIGWWTVFSVLTGALGANLIALLAVRFFMGAGEGFHPPAMWRVLSNWFPIGKRSVPTAMLLTALALGPAFVPSIALPVIQAHGWEWVFFLTAIPGVLVVVLVVLVLRDSPEQRDLRAAPPRSSDTLPKVKVDKRQWRAPHIWLTFLAFLFFGFALYGLMGWLPTYLITYRGLNVTNAGFFATSPYIAGTIGMILGALICNRWFKAYRRQFIAVTYVLTAACFLLTALAPSTTAAGVWMTASGFFLYFGYGPFWAVPMDIVKQNEVGMWLGFINMGPQIAGFAGPIFIGWLIQTTGSFTPALVAMVVALVLAAICLTAVRTTANRAVAAGETVVE
jgi:MFS family permease